MLTRLCALCNKVLIKKQFKSSISFCDRVCSNKYYGKKRRKNNKCSCGNYAKAGCVFCQECISSKKYLPSIPFEQIKRDYTRKKVLIKERGNICEICGITEWLNKPILLILDHIDGNSLNSSKVNLRLICSNCDSTLPTYKGRNKGKGRYSRKERYAAGKSF